MAIDNTISVLFSDEDIEKMNAAIAMLNEALEGKVVNLTPEERRQYGSIADRNKLLVDKAKFYMEKAPQTMPRIRYSCSLEGQITGFYDTYCKSSSLTL